MIRILGEIEDFRPDLIDDAMQYSLRIVEDDNFILRYLESRRKWLSEKTNEMMMIRLLHRAIKIINKINLNDKAEVKNG